MLLILQLFTSLVVEKIRSLHRRGRLWIDRQHSCCDRLACPVYNKINLTFDVFVFLSAIVWSIVDCQSMCLPFDAANSVRLKISGNGFAACLARFAFLYMVRESFNAFVLFAASFALIHDDYSSTLCAIRTYTFSQSQAPPSHFAPPNQSTRPAMVSFTPATVVS